MGRGTMYHSLYHQPSLPTTAAVVAHPCAHTRVVRVRMHVHAPHQQEQGLRPCYYQFQDSLEDVCAGQRPDHLSAPKFLGPRGSFDPPAWAILRSSPHSNTAKQEGPENRSAPEPRGGHVKGSLRYLRTEYSSVRAPRRLGASSSVPA